MVLTFNCAGSDFSFDELALDILFVKYVISTLIGYWRDEREY